MAQTKWSNNKAKYTILFNFRSGIFLSYSCTIHLILFILITIFLIRLRTLYSAVESIQVWRRGGMGEKVI